MSSAEHHQKAESNARFISVVEPTSFDDWTFTGCYYTFIHYLRSYLYAHGENPPPTHLDLRRTFERLAAQPAHAAALGPLATNYALLTAHISSVRYDQSDASWPVATPKSELVAFATRTAPQSMGFAPIR